LWVALIKMNGTAISAAMNPPHMGLSFAVGMVWLCGLWEAQDSAHFSVSAPALPWLHRPIRVPDPKDRVDEQRSVKSKTSGYGCAKARNAKTKPIHCRKSCTCARNQAHGIGVHGRDAAAEALTDEKQAQAQPEAQIRWSNNPKILRADALYFGVVAE